jgi:hypothetical protein
MDRSRIIHVEAIEHDPLRGELSGVAIRREPDGGTTRHRVATPVERPDLLHSEAQARLRAAALPD